MTTVTIVGNVTDTPELRFTPSGAGVANFTVAVNHRRLNRQTNEWEDAGTDYYRCAAWRELSENIAATIMKGMRVVVTGTTKHDHFERQDGSKGMAVVLTVDDIGPSLRFATATVNRTQRGGGGGGQQQAAPSNPWGGGQQQAAPQAAPAASGWGGGGQAYDDPPF